MHRALGLAVTLFVASPAIAQMSFQAETASSVEVAAAKVTALAGAFADAQYAWRPADGVRSVEEAFRHIAGTNYWMLTRMGCDIPEETGFTADYNTVVVFEGKSGREETEQVLAASFEHLKSCTLAITDAQLDAAMDLFGNPGTGRGYLMLTSTHLHEHLGQVVAYARSNGVVPPWSN